MSVDVEDYFQVSAFEDCVDRRDWDGMESRVEINVYRILSLFGEYNIKATFFTLGWVAQRYPRMIERIVEGGHEVASHGWDHKRVTEMTPEQFAADVVKAKQLLEKLSGQQVIGYRAPSYSIGSDNLWAQDVLADTGHVYSSSVVPVKHDLYGMPEAPRFAYKAAEGRLLEIPITTVPVAGRNINCGGGGWFRLFPYAFTRRALKKVNQQEGESAVFYFHPWEVDPEQPRIEGASFKSRFRHYLNLQRMEPRLEQLIRDFSWGRMDEVFVGER
ncbi:MAG: polysaccharide deacetylase family protein [Gammaproteobacteria bacterium]|nr:MAG: polysaccharide deacetylase family protein [Gammaproteobacteria bacterium]